MNHELRVTGRWDPTTKGTCDVRVFLNDAEIFVDRGDPRSVRFRDRVVERVCHENPTIDRDDLARQMMALGRDLADRVDAAGDDQLSKSTREEALHRLDEESAEALADTPPAIRACAEHLLGAPNLIDQLIDGARALGVVGEEHLILQVYLIGTSRLLFNPLAGIVQGTSSSGKSFIIDRVAKLFPDEAKLLATDITPQALYYLPVGGLVHRFVVAGERHRAEVDEHAEATRALREMIGSGELRKAVPMKNGNSIETRVIFQPGPISYIESTTLTRIFDEDANRALLLTTDESEQQTQRIVEDMASRSAESDGQVAQVIAVHHAAQRMLKRVRVEVPYRVALARHVPVTRPTARRAFGHLLRTIEVLAVLHQRQRAQGEIQHGDVIQANLRDYAVARELLLGPLGRSLGSDMPKAVVNFGKRLWSQWGTKGFTTTEAWQKDQQVGRNKAGDYLRTLAAHGLVEQTQAGAGSRPASWQMEGPPAETTATWLPKVEELQGCDLPAEPSGTRTPGGMGEQVANLRFLASSSRFVHPDSTGGTRGESGEQDCAPHSPFVHPAASGSTNAPLAPPPAADSALCSPFTAEGVCAGIAGGAVTAVGDYVQWRSGGADQFRKPRRVLRVEAGYAFFAGSGTGAPLDQLTVVGVPARVTAAHLIREARQSGARDQAIAMRDAWEERMAICTVDGGLPEREAETVALSELRGWHAARRLNHED